MMLLALPSGTGFLANDIARRAKRTVVDGALFHLESAVEGVPRWRDVVRQPKVAVRQELGDLYRTDSGNSNHI